MRIKLVLSLLALFGCLCKQPGLAGQFQVGRGIGSIALSSDGKYLAYSEFKEPDTLHLVEVRTGDQIASARITTQIGAISFLESPWKLILGAMSGDIVAYDIQIHQIVMRCQQPPEGMHPFLKFRLLSSGMIAALASDNKKSVVYFCDSTSGMTQRIERSFLQVTEKWQSFDGNWDNSTFVANDDSVEEVGISISNEFKKKVFRRDQLLGQLARGPDRNLWICVTKKNLINGREYSAGTKIYALDVELNLHGIEIQSEQESPDFMLDFSGSGAALVVSGEKPFVEVYRMKKAKLKKVRIPGTAPPASAATSADGSTVAIQWPGGLIQVFKLDELE